MKRHSRQCTTTITHPDPDSYRDAGRRSLRCAEREQKNLKATRLTENLAMFFTIGSGAECPGFHDMIWINCTKIRTQIPLFNTKKGYFIINLPHFNTRFQLHKVGCLCIKWGIKYSISTIEDTEVLIFKFNFFGLTFAC
jgi:hypothetical protein